MRVRDFMQTEVITTDIHTPIMAALDTMKQNKIKRLPVTRKGKFVGLVTRAMIRDASPSEATSLSIYELNYLISRMTVGDIMVKDPMTISPDLPVEDAIWLGREHGYGAFPVMEDNELVGIITESDVANVVIEALGVRKKDNRRITIDASEMRFGFLRDVLEVIDSHQIPVLSIITIPKSGNGGLFLILRLKAKDPEKTVEELKQKGIRVTDVT